jgi:hypothetical protein
MVKLLPIILILLISCSPQKRLNRLVKNHPHLIENDTIIVHDTIIIPSITHDTTTIFVPNKTVEVINNERVRLHYIYDTITNTITHDVECKEVVINREIAVPVEKYKLTNDLSWIKWLVILGLALVGLVVFLKIT